MFENIKWLFFDVGSTIVDEHLAYEHRMREIADSANTTYTNVYEMAITFYKQNEKSELTELFEWGILFSRRVRRCNWEWLEQSELF